MAFIRGIANANAAVCAVIAIGLGLIIMCQGAGNGNDGYSYNSDPVQNYRMLPTSRVAGQERALCFGKYSRCQMRIMRCPSECPVRKPKNAKKKKGCMIDCSNKCETTCKIRKPNCKGYGAVCYDPRFVGGDGVMFYFHGMKDRDFALVSDNNMQINAHFIGSRPEGRKRDYTWVQALAIMFNTHSLTVSANKVSSWNESIDHFSFSFDGQEFGIPQEVLAVWSSPSRQVAVERTDDTNSVNILLPGIAKISVNVAPIDERENKMHNYQLPSDDVFAHLEMQFKFFNISSSVEGVLGQTYRPHFNNPVKRGVAMPIMGGEDRYATSSLLSPDCKSCRFSAAVYSSADFIINPVETFNAECKSSNSNGGIVCRR